MYKKACVCFVLFVLYSHWDLLDPGDDGGMLGTIKKPLRRMFILNESVNIPSKGFEIALLLVWKMPSNYKSWIHTRVLMFVA